jgi:hypothetical protein
MMSETVEERGRHLGVSEDARPFAEGQIGRDDDRGALIELAHEMEEQLPASLSEGQIAKFVENGEVLAGEIIGDPSLTPCACFGFQAINEIDCIEETATQTGADAASRDGNGEMRLAGSGASNENDIALLRDEAAPGKIAHQGFVNGRAVEVKIIDFLVILPVILTRWPSHLFESDDAVSIYVVCSPSTHIKLSKTSTRDFVCGGIIRPSPSKALFQVDVCITVPWNV